MHLLMGSQFFRLGVTTKNFVFITHGWYQTGWWSERLTKSPINCSDADMMEMLQGVIAVHQFPLARNNSIPTASGLVSRKVHACVNTYIF